MAFSEMRLQYDTTLSCRVTRIIRLFIRRIIRATGRAAPEISMLDALCFKKMRHAENGVVDAMVSGG